MYVHVCADSNGNAGLCFPVCVPVRVPMQNFVEYSRTRELTPLENMLQVISNDLPRTFAEHPLLHTDAGLWGVGRRPPLPLMLHPCILSMPWALTTTFLRAAGELALCRLLHAFVARNPQIGYSQGLSYLAAFLLLNAHLHETLMNEVSRKPPCLFLLFSSSPINRFMDGVCPLDPLRQLV